MEPKNKGGRPKKRIDFDQLKKLCGLFCTQQECASVLEVSVEVIDREIKEAGYAGGFTEYYKIHSSTGKASLRRMQFKSAMGGNTSMLIWLGKQYLKQSDQGSETQSDAPLPLLNYRPPKGDEAKDFELPDMRGQK